MSRQQNPLIQVKDLKKYYPVKTGIIPHVTDYVKAVDGVSFSIYEGESLGLVGESGCGKTTIGKLLTGLEKPTEGAILYRGMDILDWTAKEQKKYRTKIQMIFQDPYSSLNPRKHIYEILAAPMLYHGISDKQTVEKDVKELLEMVGMPQSALGRYPHEFSGGQRQRIGIARALSLKPEFIVCDEPVSALDVSVQAQIMDADKRGHCGPPENVRGVMPGCRSRRKRSCSHQASRSRPPERASRVRAAPKPRCSSSGVWYWAAV